MKENIIKKSFFFLKLKVLSSHEDEPAANDNTPISPPNVEVVSDTKWVKSFLISY